VKIEKRQTISIGIPVKNEMANISFLIEVVSRLISDLEASGFNVEVIVNDNASDDGSNAALRAWANAEAHIKLFEYPAGVSFQASILEMMKQSCGDAFVVFQSDLQDPPELILEFVKAWAESGSIVAGVITKRQEKSTVRVTRRLFYLVLRRFSDGNFISGFQDFYLLPKDVYKNLCDLSPEGLFLRGHISSRFSNVKTISYVRSDRLRGNTNFNFARKYTLALDGILLFGTRFIRLVSTVSLGIFVFGILMILFLVGSYLLGFRAPVPGWTSVGVGFLMLLSLFGMTSSLILEYLVRIYRFLVLQHSELKPKRFERSE
jgi:glycosyltransferase involved in cell wall biosynthesis